MGLYNCIGRKDMNVEIFLFGLIFLLPKGSICCCFFFQFRLLRIIHLSRSGPCTHYFIVEVLFRLV